MFIKVHVQDAVYSIQCSRGDQLVRWLGFVGCQRYTMDKGHLHLRQFVPKGVLLQDGTVLNPNKPVTEAVPEDAEVWVEVGEGAQAFSLRWEGRPVTPPFEVEMLQAEAEEEEALVVEGGPAHQWIRNYDFKQHGIEKVMMMDLKKLSDEELLELSKVYQGFVEDGAGLAIKASRDYVATKLDGLSFKKGDVIQILDNSDALWWKGSLNGKVGLFPLQYLELEQVIANREFNGSKPEELGFKKGDIIAILDKNDPNWWRGQISGRVGIFPRTFVSKLPRTETGELDSGTRFIAVRDVTATSPEELSFRKGDIVAVLDMTVADRWKGACNGNVGSFPSSAVKVLQDAGVGTVLARRDYTANKVGELSFKRGARIVLLDKRDPEMWKGMNNGQVGLFPSTHVDSEQMTALQNHPARNAEELPFEAGQVITILDRAETDRWRGELAGEVGTFPSRLVARSEQILATRDYSASRSEELSFRKGDVITILEKSDPEFVRANVNGKIGLIPKAYITLLDYSEDETKVIAVKDYEATSERELSFSKFTVVHLLETKDPTLWKGQVGSQTGYFPRAAVEPILGQSRESGAKSGAKAGRRVMMSRQEIIQMELGQLRDLFLEYAPFVKNLFSYYSAVNSVGYVDVNTMSNAQFQSLTKDCRLSSPSLRVAEIDIIFAAAQIRQATLPGVEKRGKDSERMMGLEEFLGALIRLANAKYRNIARLTERVRQLIVADLLPNAMPFLYEYARKLKLVYKSDVRSVLDKYRQKLGLLFNGVVNEAKGKVTFDRFCSMAKSLGMIGGELSVFNIRCIFMYVTSAPEVGADKVLEFSDDNFEVNVEQFNHALAMCARITATQQAPADAPFPPFLDSYLAKLAMGGGGEQQQQ